jgi:hypothetical protein
VVGAIAVRVWGTAARAATTLEDGVRDPGRHIMYSGPMLFDLTIMFFGCKILHRQTKRIKFHIAPIVSFKMMNREEILNHVRSKQNIIKVKWPGKNRVTYGGDQKRRVIIYNDRGRIGRGQRTKSRNITNWWDGVVCRARVHHPVLD